jgi:hypothetical protein
MMGLKPEFIQESLEEPAGWEPKAAGEMGKEHNYLSLLWDWL